MSSSEMAGGDRSTGEQYVMRITAADKADETTIFEQPPEKGPSPEYLASLVDAIRLHADDHTLTADLKRQIDQLPSRHNALHDMSTIEIELVLKVVKEVWKKVTGEDLPEDRETPPQSAKDLDGNFWLLPGGILVRGYNHFTAAKKHKGMFCGLLRINPWVFEHRMASSPDTLIGMLIEYGAIRANIDREKSRALFQCTSQSWPTARDKVFKMFHKHRIVKVIDVSKPYHGWKSGIPLILNK